MPVAAPYGSWISPVASSLIASSVIDLAEISLDGGSLYWIEMRPEEQGRYCVVRRSPDGQVGDLLPEPWNMRTRVHEYGGASYRVHEGVLYFSNFVDQRLYRLVPGGKPEPLTPSGQSMRYADYILDARRKRLIGVREDHANSSAQAVNSIVSIALDRGEQQSGEQVLVSGKDFYSNPRLSPDGACLCWLEWNHPNMPWDGCELWAADVSPDGALENTEHLAGGAAESIFQPTWSPDGVLYFISDRTGWWNLYRWQNKKVEALHPVEADFGVPQWVFGQSTFAFETPERLVCSYLHAGCATVAVLDTRTLDFQTLALPYTDVQYMTASPGRVFFIGGSPALPPSLVELDLQTGQTSLIKQSTRLVIDPGYLSIPELIEFPTSNGVSAYAFYYAPTNMDFTAPAGELPPLIVLSHGGPTSATSTVFSLRRQYWTSRGFGVLDVDYGGSSGYGRPYRERLNGQMGIVDVADCANGARYLASQGRVDPERMAIHGGSAGGFTTLAALTYLKVFKAGASHFGISDLETLAVDTHKFESHYLDTLVGPYPAAREVYIARSPIHFIDQLDCALIIFQGSEDKVVPPQQSRLMYEAVRLKGLPVAYLEFPGEGHGFRQADHIKKALDAELYFYGKVFGFTPADPLEAVDIKNINGDLY